MSKAEELLNTVAGDESTYAVSPSNEPHIVIGSDRSVIVPDMLKRIAVQFDHNVETVTFDCPRYWDGIDFTSATDGINDFVVYINYMLGDGTLGSYVAQNVSADPEDSSIVHFDWTISNNVTQVAGKITFLVCIKKVDSEGNEINHWNSELCRDMFVSEGMEVTETLGEMYPDFITQVLVTLNRYNQSEYGQVVARIETLEADSEDLSGRMEIAEANITDLKPRMVTAENTLGGLKKGEYGGVVKMPTSSHSDNRIPVVMSDGSTEFRSVAHNTATHGAIPMFRSEGRLVCGDATEANDAVNKKTMDAVANDLDAKISAERTRIDNITLSNSTFVPVNGTRCTLPGPGLYMFLVHWGYQSASFNTEYHYTGTVMYYHTTGDALRDAGLSPDTAYIGSSTAAQYNGNGEFNGSASIERYDFDSDIVDIRVGGDLTKVKRYDNSILGYIKIWSLPET